MSDQSTDATSASTDATMSTRAMDTSRSAASAERMKPKVAPGTARIPYLPAGVVVGSEDVTLGRLWGCKASTAHQRKLKVADEAADVIRVKRTAGATESLALWLRPIEEALECRTPCPDPELAASRADAIEDVVEAEWRANKCEATARKLLQKRAIERQCSWDHDRALAAQYGIRL